LPRAAAEMGTLPEAAKVLPRAYRFLNVNCIGRLTSFDCEPPAVGHWSSRLLCQMCYGYWSYWLRRKSRTGRHVASGAHAVWATDDRGNAADVGCSQVIQVKTKSIGRRAGLQESPRESRGVPPEPSVLFEWRSGRRRKTVIAADRATRAEPAMAKILNGYSYLLTSGFKLARA
jgi:hypothetical protein